VDRDRLAGRGLEKERVDRLLDDRALLDAHVRAVLEERRVERDEGVARRECVLREVRRVLKDLLRHVSGGVAAVVFILWRDRRRHGRQHELRLLRRQRWCNRVYGGGGGNRRARQQDHDYVPG